MLRNVHDMNYADIEKGINALGEKAKHNQVRFYVSSDKKFKEMKQQSQLFSFFIATLLHPICSIYTVQKCGGVCTVVIPQICTLNAFDH